MITIKKLKKLNLEGKILMGKLGSYIKKVEQLKNDTIVVSRDTYLKNLRELAKLRYTVSKVKNKKME